MFLWIIERQDSFKPQNDALLIKCFLEELLRSKDPKGAPREHFDYLNKISLLSIIAKAMYDLDDFNYSMQESSVLKLIEDELNSIRFSFYRARDILNEFLELSIFVEEDSQRIRFRFLCFFEYFLYEYMRTHKDFFDYVMQENNFLNFCNEINYYTGINRNASELVNTIMSRLEYDYIDINDIVFDAVNNIDEFFNVQTSLLQRITADDLIKVLPEKETEEDKERQLDKKLLQACSNDPEVIRKKNNNKFLNYSKLLLLAMNVLKNSEEIKPINGHDNTTKRYYYDIVLKNSISYSVLYRLICLEMFRHQEHFPKSRIDELRIMVRFLPVIHEELVRSNLGTYKLSDVIYEKIQSDNAQISNNSISEFERFLSVFLYADLKAKSYMDVIQYFLKNFKRTYIADASYLKLIGYYYTSEEKSFDQRIINWLSDLYIKVNSTKGGKTISKSQIIKQLTRNKEIHDAERKRE